MVKPESQARSLNTRSNPSERRSIPDTEAQTNSNLIARNSAAIEYQPTPKQSNPEDIENDFLKYYSNFLGSDLNGKTTWKSENFSQNQVHLKTDRTEDFSAKNHRNPVSD
jgi:hypothetical protein